VVDKDCDFLDQELDIRAVQAACHEVDHDNSADMVACDDHMDIVGILVDTAACDHNMELAVALAVVRRMRQEAVDKHHAAVYANLVAFPFPDELLRSVEELKLPGCAVLDRERSELVEFELQREELNALESTAVLEVAELELLKLRPVSLPVEKLLAARSEFAVAELELQLEVQK
jgi:hypothetical protein